MDFETFKRKTVEAIGKLAGDASVEIHEVVKNNNTKYTGLMARTPGSRVSPVVYLESYYEDVCSGRGFLETMGKLWDACRRNAGNGTVDVSGFADWRSAKERISVRLVHYRENRGRLETMPHRKFLDLAAVYYYIAWEEGGSLAVIQVDNRHMGMWGIGMAELEEAGSENHVRQYRTEIRRMDELVGELAGIRPEDAGAPLQMYVATNRWKLGGAAAMLFPEEFSGLADKLGCDLCSLPSSVHELIVLPVYMGEPDELAGIVREVNRTQVLPEDRLSDSVYIYERKSCQVRIA